MHAELFVGFWGAFVVLGILLLRSTTAVPQGRDAGLLLSWRLQYAYHVFLC